MPKEARKKVKRSIWPKLFGGIWYLFVCFLFLSAGTVFGWGFSSEPLKAILLGAVGMRETEPKTVFNAKEMTVLLLGCDENRYYGKLLDTAARSDMMLLAKFDFENNRVGGISIPRDLEVRLDGKSHKINAYHALGGPELSKKAVESVVGMPIDRVMVLNYDAFQEMVDIVGGVEVYVPKKMDYDDWGGRLHIHLKPGRQMLTGQQAMGFVRFRHSDNDFARVERQRDLMLAFKQAVMAHATALPAVVSKASEALGGRFTPDEIAALSFFMRKVKSDQIKMGTLPVRDGKGSFLVVDERNLQSVLEAHYLKPRMTALNTHRRRDEL